MAAKGRVAAPTRITVTLGPRLETLIHPVILYSLVALGAVGVALALPRKGLNPQVLGGLLASIAGGLVILLLGIRAVSAVGVEALPNLFFYVFAVVALGGSLRVITHPRPVYAALYFILTILASSGMYVILSAEFLAFALVIVYAGAILITYLFVIMLATQAPTEDQLDVLADYDTISREPIAASAAGFLLLALLTTMLFSGVRGLPAPGHPGTSDALLADLPGRVESALRRGELFTEPARSASSESEPRTRTLMRPLIEPEERIAKRPDGRPWIDTERRIVVVEKAGGAQREVAWPADLDARNVEGVGFNLLRDHPGTIEIAGVILLMAMLGAVVLARKQVQIDEEAKARQAQHLSSAEPEVLP